MKKNNVIKIDWIDRKKEVTWVPPFSKSHHSIRSLSLSLSPIIPPPKPQLLKPNTLCPFLCHSFLCVSFFFSIIFLLFSNIFSVSPTSMPWSWAWRGKLKASKIPISHFPFPHYPFLLLSLYHPSSKYIIHSSQFCIPIYLLLLFYHSSNTFYRFSLPAHVDTRFSFGLSRHFSFFTSFISSYFLSSLSFLGFPRWRCSLTCEFLPGTHHFKLPIRSYFLFAFIRKFNLWVLQPSLVETRNWDYFIISWGEKSDDAAQLGFSCLSGRHLYVCCSGRFWSWW